MKLRLFLGLLTVVLALVAVPWPGKSGAVEPGSLEAVRSAARDEVFRARWVTLDGVLVQLEERRRSGETALAWLARAATKLAEECAGSPPIEGWIEPWPAEGVAGSEPHLTIDWSANEHVQCRVRLQKPAERSAELWSLEVWDVKSAVERCLPDARRSES